MTMSLNIATVYSYDWNCLFSDLEDQGRLDCSNQIFSLFCTLVGHGNHLWWWCHWSHWQVSCMPEPKGPDPAYLWLHFDFDACMWILDELDDTTLLVQGPLWPHSIWVYPHDNKPQKSILFPAQHLLLKQIWKTIFIGKRNTLWRQANKSIILVLNFSVGVRF